MYTFPAFQSTRPIRGATDHVRLIQTVILFQSTRPIRGATQIRTGNSQVQINFNPRAPYGARHKTRHRVTGNITFQSTRPIRGATLIRHVNLIERAISIHAPHTGRDVSGLMYTDSGTISIHAPHTGRDPFCGTAKTLHVAFQSTRPIRGATYLAYSASVRVPPFQSTRPIRGATKIVIPLPPVTKFQSTRPIRGATR